MNDQRSLTEQLDDLAKYATETGLYDAADWLRRTRNDRGCRHVWAYSSTSTSAGSPPPGTPCTLCFKPYGATGRD